MAFAAPNAYDRLIGRYSRALAPRLIEFATVEPGARVLDAGCGTGILTEALAARVGAERVAAVDLSEPFLAVCAARVPGADVRRASIDDLPWPDGAFDAALSQLVLSFVPDAAAAARELRRVVRPGGLVAASAFDVDGFRVARVFWDAALATDPGAPDDSFLPLRRTGELEELWRSTGFTELAAAPVDVETEYESFDDLWEPIAAGVGPMGSYLGSRGEEGRTQLRETVRGMLGNPEGRFTLPARALQVRGAVPAA